MEFSQFAVELNSVFASNSLVKVIIFNTANLGESLGEIGSAMGTTSNCMGRAASKGKESKLIDRVFNIIKLANIWKKILSFTRINFALRDQLNC